MTVIVAFTWEANKAEVARQEYVLAKEHYKAFWERRMRCRDHAERFADALERLDRARERLFRLS